MKHSSLLYFFIMVVFFIGCDNVQKSAPLTEDGSLKWLKMEEAIDFKNSGDKIYFVDVYTEWCGWCKRMDKSTFKDEKVVKYLAENFVPVKFDAENKNTISFKGKDYKFVKGGRRGHNTLARELLKGRLSYPSFAYLDAEMNNIMVSPGYKDSAKMLAELERVVANN